MDPEAVAAAIDRQRWLDPVANAIAGAVDAALEAGGPAGETARDVLRGKWLGHPLHPALTDVPLGAWTATAVLDAADAAHHTRETAAAAAASLAVGLAAAVPTALSGLTEFAALRGRPSRIGVVHGLLNLSITGLYGASWLLRKRRSRSLARTLAWLGFGISGASAYLGGVLVYHERVGVEPAQAAGEDPRKVPADTPASAP